MQLDLVEVPGTSTDNADDIDELRRAVEAVAEILLPLDEEQRTNVFSPAASTSKT